MIDLTHCSKWYGVVIGLNDVTLSVGPGVTGLLGPNGAGKSTMMKLVTGLMRASQGDVKVLGEHVYGNRDVLRRIGYCPEHEGVYTELTALEFVTAMARISGYDAAAAKKRAEEALERLDLTSAMHRRLGGFSKGMRQRTKLAQALVHDPDVLFLDEPLTGTDPIARAQIQALLEELGRAGKTILVSLHVLHEVERLTQEIVLIYRGRVLAEGNIYKIRELIDHHPHRVRVDCDRPHELAGALMSAGLAVRVEVSAASAAPGRMIIETLTPDTAYDSIPAFALDRGIHITELSSPDNNLEAVFRYLTERVAGARTTALEDA